MPAALSAITFKVVFCQHVALLHCVLARQIHDNISGSEAGKRHKYNMIQKYIIIFEVFYNVEGVYRKYNPSNAYIGCTAF